MSTIFSEWAVCARVCHHPCEAACRAGESDGGPIAIRALKRHITANVSPTSHSPGRREVAGDPPRVAVVGSGPAGLTAASGLGLLGYSVTVFEADKEPGGMLVSGIPAFRLPHDVVRQEVAALLGEGVTVHCRTALGREITLVQEDQDLQEKRTRARLLSTSGPTLEVDGAIMVGHPGRMELPELPPGLLLHPALGWLAESGKAGTALLEARYLTGGVVFHRFGGALLFRVAVGCAGCALLLYLACAMSSRVTKQQGATQG